MKLLLVTLFAVLHLNAEKPKTSAHEARSQAVELLRSGKEQASLAAAMGYAVSQMQVEPDRVPVVHFLDSLRADYRDVGVQALSDLFVAEMVDETTGMATATDTLRSDIYLRRVCGLREELKTLRSKDYRDLLSDDRNSLSWRLTPTLYDVVMNRCCWLLDQQTEWPDFHKQDKDQLAYFYSMDVCGRWSDKEHYEQFKAYLKQHPTGVGAAYVRSFIASYEGLTMRGRSEARLTTHDSVPFCFTGKNAQDVRVRIYTLKAGKADEKSSSKEVPWVRDKRIVNTRKHLADTLPALNDAADTLQLPPLPYGYYELEYAARQGRHWETASSPVRLRVTDLRLYTRLYKSASDSRQEAVAVDAWTGEEVKDAKIWVDTVHGTWRDTYYWRVERGDDKWHARVQIDRQSAPESSLTAMLMTDRSIYRPGDTVHVVAYAYQPGVLERIPYANQDLELQFSSYVSDYKTSVSVRTDDYGAVTADFRVPEEEKTGGYYLSLREAGHSMVGKRVQVEAFKLPTFRVSLDETQRRQVNTDSTRIVGRVTSYAGDPLPNQTVVMEVGTYGSGKGTSAETLTLTTDERGCFRYSMAGDSTRYYCMAQVTVTDAAGETQGASTTVYYRNSRPETTTEKPAWDVIPEGKALYLPEQGRTLTQDSVVWQVGTQYDCWLYYEATTEEDGLWRKGFVQLHKGWIRLALPRPQKRNQELTVRLYVTAEGNCESERVFLPAAVRDEAHLTLHTFRDEVIPGSKETIRLQLTNEKGEGVEGRVTATLIHKALWDKQNNPWIWRNNYKAVYHIALGNDGAHPYGGLGYVNWCRPTHVDVWPLRMPTYQEVVSAYGYRTGRAYGMYGARLDGVVMMESCASNRVQVRGLAAPAMAADAEEMEEEVYCVVEKASTKSFVKLLDNVTMKQSDTKTAFWVANRPTDKNGWLDLNYQVPLDNAQFQLQVMGVTPQMQADTVRRLVTIMRPLKAHLQLPRFLRQGDEGTLVASIQNLLPKATTMLAVLEVFNPETGEVYNADTLQQKLAAKGLTDARIRCRVPQDVTQIGLRLRVVNETGDGDGEQRLLAVLPSLVPVTMTTPFYLRPQDKQVCLTPKSWPTEATERRMLLEVERNPMYYVLEALQVNYDSSAVTPCGLVHNYYAVAMANHLKPQPQAREQLATLLKRMQALQRADGGLAWLPDSRFRSDWYSTLTVLEQLGELQQHGVARDDAGLNRLIDGMLGYVDSTAVKAKVLSPFYTYVRSLYRDSHKPSLSVQNRLRKGYAELADNWVGSSIEEKAYTAMTLQLGGREKQAAEVMNSLRDLAKNDSVLGMYWFVWDIPYDRRPVKTQALLLRAFAMVDPQVEELDAIRQWLLLNKQTTGWGHSSLVAEAASALIETGSQWLSQSDNAEREERVVMPTEKQVVVKQTTDRPAWGHLLQQCIAPAAHVETMGDGYVQMSRSVKGDTKKVGSQVTVTLTLTTDRAVDHVLLAEPRPANFEPVDSRSHYDFSGKWLRGMPYYVDVRDTENRYYIEHLPAGVHTISYSYYVTHLGNFLNAPATVRVE